MDLNYSKQFALYFDRLRYEKGLTQEEFVESIISLRQYRRYLNGTSHIPQDIIDSFARRLGYRPHHVMLEFEGEKIQEGKRVENLYNLIVNQDFVGAQKFMQEYPIEQFIDQENKELYIHAVNYYHYLTKKITESEFIRKTMELLNYPLVLDRNSMSINELVMLTSLIGLREFKDKAPIAEKLIYYADRTHRIYSGRNEGVLTYILVQVAKYFGINKVHHKVIETCNRALQFNLEMKLSYLLDFLYYYKALSHFELGEIDAHEECLFKLYATLQSEGSPAKYERFRRLVETDWPINFHQFAKEYIAKKLLIEK